MSKMGISTYHLIAAHRYRSDRPECRICRSIFYRHGHPDRGHRPASGGRRSGAHPPVRIRQRSGTGERARTGGEYAYRVRGEEHMWTPDTIAKLQNATRTNNSRPTRIRQADQRSGPAPETLRGLFEIKPAGAPVPLEEVEPAKEIVKRFVTGAMSLVRFQPRRIPHWRLR